MSSAAGTGVSAHPYTCNTCQVAYRNAELQKGHMKSDWHRYNLKRRVASLPPIAAEAFTEKVLQARAETTAQADKAFFEKFCDPCQKTYYSENSFQNHLSSQKHKARVARGPPPAAGISDETSSVMSSTFSMGEPVHTPADDEESLDSSVKAEFNEVIEGLQKTNLTSETRPSPVKRPTNPQASKGPDSDDEGGEGAQTPTPSQQQPDPATLLQHCLFCRYMSPTVRLNAHHMERFHGMVIPEKEYLVDLDGLIAYLSAKVYEGLMCLSCGKSKANAFAVQTHMRDVGHCTIPFSSEGEQLEIGDFYDFRSTYSDDEEDSDEEDEEATDTETTARRAAKTKKNAAGKTEEDGWETDSSASSFDSEELTAVPADDRQAQYDRMGRNPHHSHSGARAHHLADGWHSHAHKNGARAVFHDDYELHLPSGKSVGHRALNRYYRQNLNNYPTPEEREQKLLENGGGAAGEDGEGEDGEENRGRAVIPRPQQGIVGVTGQRREGLRKEVQRGRDVEHVRRKKRDLAYGETHNNMKNYYYRYDGGG